MHIAEHLIGRLQQSTHHGYARGRLRGTVNMSRRHDSRERRMYVRILGLVDQTSEAGSVIAKQCSQQIHFHYDGPHSRAG